jgi:hypothetical protein
MTDLPPAPLLVLERVRAARCLQQTSLECVSVVSSVLD